MIKMFNVSLEDFEIQCDSKVFVFRKRSSTLVDNHLVSFVYEQTKDRGIFPITASMTKQEIKKAARTAMLCYLSGTLQQRIRNYVSQQDDFKKKGVTFSNTVQHERAIRWEKEIITMLEIEAPIHEELSFLNAQRREALGITDDRIQDFKGEDLFDADEIAAENGIGEAPKKKMGRPKKIQSFRDTDLDKELGA